MEFRTEEGAQVVVEGVESVTGARLVSRGGAPAQATRTLGRTATAVTTSLEPDLCMQVPVDRRQNVSTRSVRRCP